MDLPVQKLKEVVTYELDMKMRERKFFILFFRIGHISFIFFSSVPEQLGTQLQRDI
jgi:hypothetical protein